MQAKSGIAALTYFEIHRLNAYIKQIICKGIQFWLKFKYEIDYIPKIA